MLSPAFALVLASRVKTRLNKAATSTKTSLQNTTLEYRKSYAIIPSRARRTLHMYVKCERFLCKNIQ